MDIAFTTILPLDGFAALAGHNLHASLAEAQVLVSTFDKKVDKEMIASAPRLEFIANFGVGYNNIDLEACRQRHIRVTNTPQPVIEPTAELAFALMLDVSRRVAEFDRKLRNATAEPFGVMNNLSHSLYGKTLGIIGMGNIGKALARRAAAFGMRVIYHNRHSLTQGTTLFHGDGFDAEYVAFNTLLQTSDYVSLNLPYSPQVHHIISDRELHAMKSSAYLINTARGAHVDEKALISALQNGVIAGAAMDVYEWEPNISQELLHLDNVVLSPHTGTGTWEGRIDMCRNVAENILLWDKIRHLHTANNINNKDNIYEVYLNKMNIVL